MTSFVQVARPTQHPGVERAERFASWFREVPGRVDGSRASASLLLAAIVAALVVVANQVVETWSEGHLLAAWIAVWAVGFAGLALLAGPASRAAQSARKSYAAWRVARRQAAADRQLWTVALTDARIMADISRAMSQAADRDLRAYS